MKRSLRKKDLKAARKARQRDPNVKHGFRKLVIDDAIYQWRLGMHKVEIRVPGGLGVKYIVPIWQIQGFESETAWDEPHKDCFDECVVTGNLGCGRWAVTPGMVRKYIDKVTHDTTSG